MAQPANITPDTAAPAIEPSALNPSMSNSVGENLERLGESYSQVLPVDQAGRDQFNNEFIPQEKQIYFETHGAHITVGAAYFGVDNNPELYGRTPGEFAQKAYRLCMDDRAY